MMGWEVIQGKESERVSRSHPWLLVTTSFVIIISRKDRKPSARSGRTKGEGKDEPKSETFSSNDVKGHSGTEVTKEGPVLLCAIARKICENGRDNEIRLYRSAESRD